MSVDREICLKNAKLSTIMGLTREYLSIRESDFSDLVGVSYSGGATIDRPNYAQLLSFMKLLNTDLEKFLKGDFCLDSAFHHYNGDHDYLSKYQLGNKGSRLKTLSNFMCELPAYDRERILRRAQLTESHFLSSQESVGINLMANISQSLCRVSGNDSYLNEMGLKNALLFMKNPANHELKKEKNISDFYLKFVEDYTPVVESNRNYRVLSASQQRIVLETNAKEEARDFLRSHPDKIKVFSDAIGGFFKGISVHFNGKTSMVNRLLSGKPGSDSILFEVVFN